MTAPDPQPGDWVHLRAQVVELHPNGRDVIVELFSKNGPALRAAVRRDLVVEVVPRPREPHEVEVTYDERAADGRRVSYRCPDCDFAGSFHISPITKADELLKVITVGHQETA